MYDAWKTSHHALAERPIDARTDRAAFLPGRSVRHGSLKSRVREREGYFEIETLGSDGRINAFRPVRVIGVSPLRQFLIPGPAGRFQVTALAFDPVKQNWFDVFGDEDRKPHEWGFWANRGMTWNAMCATCHTTDLQKNYDAETDRYNTRYLEIGVGCEACHGPAEAHVDWQRRHPRKKPDPSAPRVQRDRWVDTCGSCHARREELNSAFRAGERFLDQFRPEIPSHRDTYYPDGQVRDEDYEYVSFLLSRMSGEGVRCIDCHEPHRGSLRMQGNDLCLHCHRGKVDPAAHSHHALDQPGGECVNCHMPVSVYMQRHPRRDHGFTIPDPLLTRELGIPNACNRCHERQTVDWAIATVEKWYGPRMATHSRDRARLVAAARAGDESCAGKLGELAQKDPLPAWRAVATGLLAPWVDRPEVSEPLVQLLKDRDPLVRLAAVEALEPIVTQRLGALEPLLNDPVRAVRVQAAWVLRRQLDLASAAGRELMEFLNQRSDQPPGAMMLGTFWADRREGERGATWFRRAITWDPHSPAPRQALALMWSELGRTHDAIAELEAACREIPDDASLQYMLGLAFAEVGQLSPAAAALERACRLDVRFARAWYNLGLARHRMGQAERALEALRRAEAADPRNSDYPFAAATVLRELGRSREAFQAAQRALRLDSSHAEAKLLLQTLK